ncbi:hypothetical protein P12x_006117 (plasmid) [Tundrisphaera lichenicola]|uniref:hypothetical protein n=1 Tax=Tundrisphaera lichenicola TaxID=2029860 RepID=UPI003EB7A7AB
MIITTHQPASDARLAAMIRCLEGSLQGGHPDEYSDLLRAIFRLSPADRRRLDEVDERLRRQPALVHLP